MARKGSGRGVDVHPLTAGRWEDFVSLFGPRGAYGGCWCMWFRQTGTEHAARGGEGNRRAMKGIVDGGRVPGLLAYVDGRPVGWVSLAPREEFGRILRSPTLRPVDDRPVWSVVCFFVARDARGKGVSSALLGAAVRYAAERGATTVEAYPVDSDVTRVGADEAYVGIASAFREAGFEEVARRSPARPIMRRRVRPSKTSNG